MKRLIRYNTLMTFFVIGYLFFNPLLTACGFIKHQFWTDEWRYLIDIVHKDHWTIAYAYGWECSEEKRAGAKKLEADIARALRIWLQPLREIETQAPIVDDFRFKMYDDRTDITIEVRAEVDFAVIDSCEIDRRSSANTSDRMSPAIGLRVGTHTGDVRLNEIIHETGHTFGLGDTYVGRSELGATSVSKGGLQTTIGTQPASVMADHFYLTVRTRFISADDENGIVWLYKVRHEGLAMKDCLFPDYVFEEAPDGCVPTSPLIFEIRQNHTNYAWAVLNNDKNLDLNTQDDAGSTALHYAIRGYDVEEKHLRTIEMLLQREDLNVNLGDKLGLTALHYAVMGEHIDLVEMLLKRRDLNVNPRDERGKTPLHYAISKDDSRIVDALLDHKDILVHLKDNGGRTPVSLARENEDPRLAAELLAHPNYALAVSSHRKLATMWATLKVR